MGPNKEDDWDDNYSVLGDKPESEFLDFECEKRSMDFDFNEGPVILSSPFPFFDGQPQSALVGERKADVITLTNTTEDPVEIWHIRIYTSNPEGSYTLSLMEPPTSACDMGAKSGFLECQFLEDRVLQPSQTLKIWLSCKPKEIGLHTAIIHFDVADDRLERLVFLIADDAFSLQLASNKPYFRPTRKKGFSCEKYVAGPRAPRAASSSSSKYFLPRYSIPPEIRELLKSKGVPSVLSEGLASGNYPSFFRHLLMMEEIHLEEEMRQYDMERVTMRRRGHYLTLEVPGLAEKRPSLVSGDYVYVKFAYNNDSDACPYQGSIHRVEADEVHLMFAEEFYKLHDDETLYNVTFTYDRVTIRRCYQAIEAARKGLDSEFLFPSCSKRTIQASPFVPQNINLNEEQMTSVEMIIGCRGAPPYVIHGPPGTGKTMTLIEAILQLYKTRKGPKGARILVCAASNSAADHILEKLVNKEMRSVDDTQIFRLNATSRPYEDVQLEILRYCFSEDKVFKCPPLSALLRYRIIICTYMSASLLYTQGIRRGQFSHIFLDEAGQASEPEAMIPIGNLCQKETVVVLAGDPMQLGPVVYSKEAERLGLGKSFLERLFDFDPYYKEDENFVTKLVRNYRCHHSILKLPSQLFYKGELMASKEETDLPLSNWRDLPCKDFPVLFVGIQGIDEREGSNPSWFNRVEARKVVEMIRKLNEVSDLNEEDIGVITPYRQQVTKIKKALEELQMEGVKVGSVEQFQGQERRVIIISTVRSTVKHNEVDSRHSLGFLTNPRRFNVAVTRAKSLLIIIGNPFIITKDIYWDKLLRYCSDNNSYIGCTLPPPTDFCLATVNEENKNEALKEMKSSAGDGGDEWREEGNVSENSGESEKWEDSSSAADLITRQRDFKKSDTADQISSYMAREVVLDEKSSVLDEFPLHDAEGGYWDEKSDNAVPMQNDSCGEVNGDGLKPWEVKIPQPCFDEEKWEDGWA